MINLRHLEAVRDGPGVAAFRIGRTQRRLSDRHDVNIKLARDVVGIGEEVIDEHVEKRTSRARRTGGPGRPRRTWSAGFTLLACGTFCSSRTRLALLALRTLCSGHTLLALG